jgi:MEMO1 family protein
VETSVRRPAVSGRFYPGDADDLRQEAGLYLSSSAAAGPLIQAIGCIAPHAGYMYSGHVAGAVFSRIVIPELCVVLCPNHTGIGQPLAIMSEGEWETPLGNVPIDATFAAELKSNFAALQFAGLQFAALQFAALEEDATAHRAEHSAEVELPFLQLRQPKLRFVPIAIGTGRFDALEHLGEALAVTIAGAREREKEAVLIVASSDMNHYEADTVTRIKDHQAIERILTLDPQGLYSVVTQQAISMCGLGPAVVMLTAAKKLGAKSAELIKYATSGDISGDRDRVVGYAGVAVS